MTRKSLLAIVLIGLMLGLAGAASAKKYNQSKHVPARHAAKINAVLARSAVKGNRLSDLTEEGQRDACSSDVEIGNVDVAPGQQAPDEVITVVQGDVININGRNAAGRCR